MDKTQRDIVANHLAEAQRHVEKGERLLERQRASIEERSRDGHDTELAEALLGEMQESQRLHVHDRDRLRRELDDDPA